MTAQDQRACPRCGADAGDFHFCPSCLAPIDSPSAIATRGALHAETSLAATADGNGESLAGHDSGAVAQVEEAPAKPSADRPELQIRVGNLPPASRDVARFEDVMSVAPTGGLDIASPAPRVSLPPPAPKEVARLEDLLTIKQADDVDIAPKTAAGGALPEVELVPEPVEKPESVAPPGHVETPPREKAEPRAERNWVPSYALRAAFWFEQASAFESSSDDDEIEELPPAAVAPQVEPVAAVEVAPEPAAAPDPEPQVPRSWLVALCLLSLVALIVILTGRCPRGCAGRKAS